jgi:hypothetical protein
MKVFNQLRLGHISALAPLSNRKSLVALRADAKVVANLRDLSRVEVFNSVLVFATYLLASLS